MQTTHEYANLKTPQMFFHNPLKKLALRKRSKTAKALQWACGHLNWTIKQWKEMTWSDKSCGWQCKALSNIQLRILESCIYVDVSLSCPTYLNIAAD